MSACNQVDPIFKNELQTPLGTFLRSMDHSQSPDILTREPMLGGYLKTCVSKSTNKERKKITGEGISFNEVNGRMS